MKGNFKKSLYFVVAAALAALIISSGCGGNGSSEVAVNRTTGSVNPTTTTGTSTGTNTTGTSTTGKTTTGTTTGTTGATTGTTGATTGTTGSTTGTTTYKYATTLVSETLATPSVYSHNGSFIAYKGTTDYYGPSLTASNAALEPISLPKGGNGGPGLINDSGQMAGTVYFNNSPSAYFWTSPTTPVALNVPAGTQLYNEALSNTGAIAALTSGTNFQLSLIVIPTPTSKLISFGSLGTGESTYISLTMSDSGILVCYVVGQGAKMFKPPYTSPGVALYAPDGKAPGSASIGKDGTVFGYDSSGASFYTLGPSYSKPTYIGKSLYIVDINSKGALCGGFNNGGGNDNQSVVWPSVTSAPIKFYNIGDPGFQPIQADFIFDNGDIEVNDDYGNFLFAMPSTSPGRRMVRLR